MKSAFAPTESEKYIYPNPLPLKVNGEPNLRIDAEVMAEPEGDRPWLTLRIPRSKGDNDAIGDYTQTVVTSGDNGDGTSLAARISKGNQGVFGLLAEEWSFERGKPLSSDYVRLDLWAGVWVDACLADAMGKGQASIAKKARSSSTKPRSGRAPSAAVSDSS